MAANVVPSRRSWTLAFVHTWCCSLALLLLIHMSYRGPLLFSTTANSLSDSADGTTTRRRCLLLEPFVKGCDSLKGIPLAPGAPNGIDPGNPLDPLLYLLMSADVPGCMIIVSTGEGLP